MHGEHIFREYKEQIVQLLEALHCGRVAGAVPGSQDHGVYGNIAVTGILT